MKVAVGGSCVGFRKPFQQPGTASVECREPESDKGMSPGLEAVTSLQTIILLGI